MALGYLVPPRSPGGSDLASLRRHNTQLAESLANAMAGKINAVKSSFTLTASASSTTLTDARIGVDSIVLLMPTTANAAAELGNGTLSIATATLMKGTAVVTHANNAQTDRTYRVLIIG